MEIDNDMLLFYNTLSEDLKNKLPINYILVKPMSLEMHEEITKHFYSNSKDLGTNYHYAKFFYKPISKPFDVRNSKKD